MNYAEICIIKRDGKREDFSISKIKNAISKAFSATGIQDEQQLIADITMNVISQFATPTITVEEIQDLVEKALMKVRLNLIFDTNTHDFCHSSRFFLMRSRHSSNRVISSSEKPL